MDAGLSTNAGPNINADGSMDADMDPGSSGLQPIDRIRLWVGLTPDQFTGLEKKGKASPSQGDRFGLRLEPIPALLRAHLFQGGDYHVKQFIAVQVEFTAIGNLTLEINEILENRSGGWWRLYGDLHLKHDKDFYYVDLESQTSLM